ncbi:MAG: hybrid sensor histidine kinase/response regulator [Burkholderiales bacterium]|nr:MAG: hybrid sensor histidine kinase/response regulator [Burkholderiales bacterium]
MSTTTFSPSLPGHGLRTNPPRRALAAVLAAGALLAGVILLVAEPDGARPRLASAAAAATSVDALLDFRQHWQARSYEDPARALGEMQVAFDQATQAGDLHTRWLLLAWLARTSTVVDAERSQPLLAQAQAAISPALKAGDRIAAFELALAVESASVLQFGRPPDTQRLALLHSLATEMDTPLHAGLVLKLRGVIASQAGQDGDAQFLYEQALSRLTSGFERAEVQTLMATLLIDNPANAATQLAIAYLEDVVRTLPPDRYPGLLTPVIRLSLLLSRAARPLEAWQLAQHAVQIADRRGNDADRAQARVARALTLLAAGDCRAALADFDLTPAASLPPSYALQALAGRALCESHLNATDARPALLQARQQGGQVTGASLAGRAQFHETLARAWEAAGEPLQALQELQSAAAIRQTLASTGQARLAQARSDSFAQDEQTQSGASRRAAWWSVLVLLALAVAAMAAVLRHQHHARSAAADRRQAQDAAHQQMLALHRAHAHQLELIRQALRRPARVLGLLAQSDGVAAAGPDVQRAHMQAVRDGGLAFADAVDALLDRLRLQDGSYVPQPQRFDLARLLDEIGQRIEPVAARKGLQWQLEAEVCGVFTDRHLLRRILINLLDHLLDHADHGILGIRVQPSNGLHRLDIHCSGLTSAPDLTRPEGAGPEDLDALGQGPATARIACELLGHALTVVAGGGGGGGGLTVCIELPHALPPPAAVGPPRPAASGRTVALVEDDAFSRITLMNALADAGLEVQAYASFDELMAPAAAGPSGVPGVLISDLHLGEYGDATEALRALRRRPEWRDVPVLMLTGDIRDEVGALATELGVALAYKPISVRRLLERIALLRSPQPLPAEAAASSGGPAAGKPAPERRRASASSHPSLSTEHLS